MATCVGRVPSKISETRQKPACILSFCSVSRFFSWDSTCHLHLCFQHAILNPSLFAMRHLIQPGWTLTWIVRWCACLSYNVIDDAYSFINICRATPDTISAINTPFKCTPRKGNRTANHTRIRYNFREFLFQPEWLGNMFMTGCWAYLICPENGRHHVGDVEEVTSFCILIPKEAPSHNPSVPNSMKGACT